MIKEYAVALADVEQRHAAEAAKRVPYGFSSVPRAPLMPGVKQQC